MKTWLRRFFWGMCMISIVILVFKLVGAGLYRAAIWLATIEPIAGNVELFISVCLVIALGAIWASWD